MIKILVVGLPGNMATTFAKHALRVQGIDIVKFSITGDDIEENECLIDGRSFHLIKCTDRRAIERLFEEEKPAIVVDYTELK